MASVLHGPSKRNGDTLTFPDQRCAEWRKSSCQCRVPEADEGAEQTEKLVNQGRRDALTFSQVYSAGDGMAAVRGSAAW